MTAAAIAVPYNYQFDDAAVFGRVSDKVAAYMERFVDDAPAAPKAPGLMETLFAKANAAVEDYFAKRQLARLNDRLLNDIGLTRADLGQIA